MAYCIGFWILSARKWFTGPVRQIEGEEPGCHLIHTCLTCHCMTAEARGIDVIDPGNAEKFEEAS